MGDRRLNETRGHARRLLERAVPLLSLPSSPDQPPEVLPDGTGLLCPTTGQIFPYRQGVLDLLRGELALKGSQKVFQSAFAAWLYDGLRAALLPRLFGVPAFRVEVNSIQDRLQVRPGDTVLDLACGQGNFTVEWARRARPEGLVLGLDMSWAMLIRASARIDRHGLGNVLLIRGDAQHLPLADNCLAKVNCSGGFHQFSDLPRVLHEIARVNTAALTASTFAEGPNDRNAGLKRWLRHRFEWHFVPLNWLGEQLAGLGYRDYQGSMAGAWFGYASARRG